MSKPQRAELVPTPPPGPQAELLAPEPLEVLREVARRFDGSAYRALIWIGTPRMTGHYEGRALGLSWGGGKLHVAMRAPTSVDLRVGQAPAWRRWLFSETLRSEGDSRHLVDPALNLFMRFGIVRLDVQGGQLTAVAATGLAAARIVACVHALHDLVWRDGIASGPQVVEPGPAKPTPRAKPARGTRCPFCHDDLVADAPVVHCATCDAPHHPSCFEEGGGCSIAGCTQSRARGRKST